MITIYPDHVHLVLHPCCSSLSTKAVGPEVSVVWSLIAGQSQTNDFHCDSPCAFPAEHSPRSPPGQVMEVTGWRVRPVSKPMPELTLMFFPEPWAAGQQKIAVVQCRWEIDLYNVMQCYTMLFYGILLYTSVMCSTLFECLTCNW